MIASSACPCPSVALPVGFEKGVNLLSMVLLLPPAPAALVLVGLAFATLSALSAAAFLRIAVFAPPGGDDGRAVLEPTEGGGLTGEFGRGDDWRAHRGQRCSRRSFNSDIVALNLQVRIARTGWGFVQGIADRLWVSKSYHYEGGLYDGSCNSTSAAQNLREGLR